MRPSCSRACTAASSAKRLRRSIGTNAPRHRLPHRHNQPLHRRRRWVVSEGRWSVWLVDHQKGSRASSAREAYRQASRASSARKPAGKVRNEWSFECHLGSECGASVCERCWPGSVCMHRASSLTLPIGLLADGSSARLPLGLPADGVGRPCSPASYGRLPVTAQANASTCATAT